MLAEEYGGEEIFQTYGADGNGSHGTERWPIMY